MNMAPLYRLRTASHGAAETTDAMTDPRPRVTKTIGNAQQTSVVSDDASPSNVLSRSLRMNPSLRTLRPTEIEGDEAERSDQQGGVEKMRRGVRQSL